MAHSGIPILTYHSVDDSGSVISIAPALFERQMRYLAKQGFRTLTLSDAVKRLHGEEPADGRTAVLTFDDGYENFYSQAFPILARYGFTATVFAVPEYCGKPMDWPGFVSGTGPMRLMSWQMLEEIHRYGIEIGAHTLTHPELTRVPPGDAHYEIVASKTMLEDRLGSTVEAFAYPYGSFNRQIKDVASSHFRCAVTTRLGKAGPGSDPHVLPRMDMFYLQNERLFAGLTTRLLERYLSARQIVRDVRAAVA